MIIRAKTFIAWMKTGFSKKQLKSIAEHGVSKSYDGYAGLMQYPDTCKLYQRFKSEIWDWIYYDITNMKNQSMLEFIAALDNKATVNSAVRFERLLVWYAAEGIAKQITNEEIK